MRAILEAVPDRGSLFELGARFVDLCDQFRLPVVAFVDQPGLVIGTEAERAGTMRRGARMPTRRGSERGGGPKARGHAPLD